MYDIAKSNNVIKVQIPLKTFAQKRNYHASIDNFSPSLSTHLTVFPAISTTQPTKREIVIARSFHQKRKMLFTLEKFLHIKYVFEPDMVMCGQQNTSPFAQRKNKIILTYPPLPFFSLVTISSDVMFCCHVKLESETNLSPFLSRKYCMGEGMSACKSVKCS